MRYKSNVLFPTQYINAQVYHAQNIYDQLCKTLHVRVFYTSSQKTVKS